MQIQESDSGTGSYRLHSDWKSDALVGPAVSEPLNPKTQRNPMNPILKTVIGGVVGAGLGFLVYRFIGCKTGTCPITASPWMSMIYGAVMGLLFASGR